MATHPTFETLLDFVEGRLPATAHQQVTEHLSSPCPACQAELEAVRHMLRLFKEEQLAEPPPTLIRRALHLFRRFHARPAPDRRPRLIARLLFDSRLVPGAVGVRGMGHEQRQQMLFGAEGLDIDLQISREADQHTHCLLGQVLTTPDDLSQVRDCLVRLTQADQVAATTTTDELGTFTLQALAPGHYELWLDLPQTEVWIPDLTIGPIEDSAT